jgi:RNA polymerase sigma factor (sigma-70 family)
MPVTLLSRRLWNEVSKELRSRHAQREAERRQERREARRREQLVLRHMPMVETIARRVWRTLTHVDRADLEQQGYIGLLEAAARYRPSAGEFSHFAYPRIRGAMIDAHKRRAYRDETHDSLDAIQESLGFMPAHLDTSGGPLPDEIAARSERARLLAAAIDGLPADERRVILAALAGTPLAETAEECGRSVAWARAKLATAREQVAPMVQGRKAA